MNSAEWPGASPFHSSFFSFGVSYCTWPTLPRLCPLALGSVLIRDEAAGQSQSVQAKASPRLQSG